jgi:hypothetical protein
MEDGGQIVNVRTGKGAHTKVMMREPFAYVGGAVDAVWACTDRGATRTAD